MNEFKLTKEQVDQLIVTKDDDLLVTFPGIPRSVLRRMKREHIKTKPPTVTEQIKADKEKNAIQAMQRDIKKRYNAVLEENDRLEQLVDSLVNMKDAHGDVISLNKVGGSKSESTAVMLFSDWHVEEQVKSESINGLNEFNLKIAQSRITQLFQNSRKMLEKESTYSQIDTVVIGLLGDFFSGNIHEELMESNYLLPMDAVLFAQNSLIDGIQFLLDNTDFNFVFQCHSGNHGRITGHQRRISTENGNSLEYYMYHMLRNHFKDEMRVKFNISESYHSYLELYDYTIRFHHGHWMKYNGGVGGIYIPVNKAIAQWNKARHADLDCFGHWHQFRDGGNFICNGSLIGYNAYALSIKADFEVPKQAFFLVSKKRHKSIVAPLTM